MNDSYEEMEFMKQMLVDKFNNRELDNNSLIRIINRISILAYELGQQTKRKG